MGTSMTPIGKYIKSRRKKLGLTVIKLAEKAGISDSIVYQYENRRTFVSDSMLFKIANALGEDYEKLKEISGT